MRFWAFSVGVVETLDIGAQQRTILHWALGVALNLVVPPELGLLRRPSTLGLHGTFSFSGFAFFVGSWLLLRMPLASCVAASLVTLTRLSLGTPFWRAENHPLPFNFTLTWGSLCGG